MIGLESPSCPNKESSYPGQLMGGKSSKIKKEWHHSLQNKRLFREAWHEPRSSQPAQTSRYWLTPHYMSCKWRHLVRDQRERWKKSQPMVTRSNVLLPIRSNVQVSSRLHLLFIQISRNWLWVRDIILHWILRTLSSFRLDLSKKLCVEFTIQPYMWDLVNSLSSQQGR